MKTVYMTKVLYLYSGVRKDKFRGKINVDYPDTQFYGLNHLGKFGVRAEFKEFDDLIKSKLLGKILGFRIRHLMLYFLAGGYDIVFGSSLLFMMVFKKIFKPKAKFILLNIGLTRTVSANKNNKLKLKLIKWLVKELDGVVCLSNVQKEYLENNFPDMKGKIFFNPLGVDDVFYKPNYENRKKYILSLGRDNGRDYKTVIETAKLMPEEEFHIVCSKRNLEGITDIPGNVKIFYDISYDELRKKYREAGMLLLVSHDDNFLDGSDCSGQTVLLDAMASGLPVIASRKKYLKDYTKDGQEILLVNFYDPANIKEKIDVLNGNSGLRSDISGSARNKVEKELSTENMARKLAAVFNSLSNNKRS